MHTSEHLNLTAIWLDFYGDGFVLRTEYLGKSTFMPLFLKVICRHLDWQVSSTVQIVNGLQPVLSAVERLTLSHKVHNRSSEWHNEINHT
jgi:hypothetical protein